MVYDEGLAHRISELFNEFQDVKEKKMFGGIAYMVNGNMSSGIVKDELMVRVGKEKYEEYLSETHAREMDFTGRSMRGFI